jgi:integrase
MTRAKGSGDGSIWQESTGRWRGQFRLPNGIIRNFQGTTKKEVRDSIFELKREVKAGLHGSLDSQQTFEQFALEYLAGEKHLSKTTLAGYQSIFRCHMKGIGHLPLSALQPRTLQAHYTKTLATHSSTTVHHVHEFFHVVLERAVKLDIIPRNPADSVDAPPIQTEEYVTLSEEQAQTMIQAVRSDRYAALYVLALTTGMRESELLGVTWEHILVRQKIVRVAKALKRVNREFLHERTKSRTSRRDIPLAPIAEESLRVWKVQQEEDQRLMGKAWQNRWNLVFTTVDGAPLLHHSILKRFRKLLRAVGLPEIRLHDLRHTYATLLIEAGVPVKVVSELLGHSSIEITLRIYGHVTPKMRDQAVNKIEQLFSLSSPMVDEKFNSHGYSHGEEDEHTDEA